MTDDKQRDQHDEKPSSNAAVNQTEASQKKMDTADHKTAAAADVLSAGQAKADHSAERQTQAKKDEKTAGQKPGHKLEHKPEHKNKPKTDKTDSITARVPWLASIAIVVGCAAGILAYQNNLQQSRQLAETKQTLLQNQQEFQQRMESVQSTLAEYKSSLAQVNDSLTSVQSEAQVGRNDLEHKIKQVALLVEEKGRDPLMWRIAEVEYLLSIANQRLLLLEDTGTALTALQDADNRLRSMADPGLSEIRKSIALEMSELKSTQIPDIAGMAARLSALVQGIEQLPLVNRDRIKSTTLETSNEVESWKQIPAAMWKDIKEMVTVHHNDHAIEPLLPPDEKHFLAQNLGLKLEQARLALLRGDTPVFRSNLKDINEWVSRYFDPQAAAVNQVMETINDLEKAELSPRLPDISNSLRQLRHWLARQKTVSYSTPRAPAKPSLAGDKTALGTQSAKSPSSDSGSLPKRVSNKAASKAALSTAKSAVPQTQGNNKSTVVQTELVPTDTDPAIANAVEASKPVEQVLTNVQQNQTKMIGNLQGQGKSQTTAAGESELPGGESRSPSFVEESSESTIATQEPKP